jgi:hypothetical protein
MVQLRFPDSENERKAIGYLAGRFSFHSYSDGRTLVPEAALARLANEGVKFTVDGRAAYEQIISAVRDSSAAAVQ